MGYLLKMLFLCVYLCRRTITILRYLQDYWVRHQLSLPQGGIRLKTHSMLLTHTPQLCLA